MYQCPRCGSSDLIDFGEILECSVCHLSFRKHFLDELEEDEILAEEEKKVFLDTLKDDIV